MDQGNVDQYYIVYVIEFGFAIPFRANPFYENKKLSEL